MKIPPDLVRRAVDTLSWSVDSAERAYARQILKQAEKERIEERIFRHTLVDETIVSR